MAKTHKEQQKRRSPDRPLEVAVLVDTCTGWGRRLVRGVSGYAIKHGPWHIWAESRGREEVMRLPRDWPGDGVIARVFNRRISDELAETGLPVVNVSSIGVDHCPFPRVSSDFRASAQLAFDHFAERGFKNFGYIGPLGRRYVQTHAGAFRETVREAGAECHIFNLIDASISNRRWSAIQKEFAVWLNGIPKPISVFSWATSAGSRTLALCRELGIAVPDEVAVLAGDNDPLLCNVTLPPMSGLVIGSEQIGYRAAHKLACMMAGEEVDPEDELIPPNHIDMRASTEVLAVEDKAMRWALQYLREHVFEPININDIAIEAALSRRQLERKFRDWLGRTPAEEIRRVRLARVRELLAETDLSVAEIATASGFSSLEYMSTAFKAATGLTPLRYRSTVRAR